ncbi:hypothetical protein PCASD_08103 [Puccinia coronata f. sp. avenae]|uniref:CCHC-type domain-containing protein n=1 Tax=Puccinia coronata f. sp. avenae TaxID=200324 RepID=A0A2N5VAH4_9BASI|nr:hypothetical protein PCASD_08103 [Puccinia coronata f. sp. avenae]
MALRAGITIEAIRSGQTNPIPSGTSAPTSDPNAMDLSAIQGNSGNRAGQLTKAKRERQSHLGLCFCCGQEGHISRGCRQGRKRTAGTMSTTACILEVQAEINQACAAASGPTNPNTAHSSKNGGAQV